jgi:hypothetical protein
MVSKAFISITEDLAAKISVQAIKGSGFIPIDLLE